MTLKFTIASEEIEDFAFELLIDSNATFLDLHKAIIKACRYTEGDNHRFYICDEDWHPEQKILLNEEATSSDEDLNLMHECCLGDFLEDEGQRLAYRFDPESRRIFIIELTETIFGSRQTEPCVKRHCGQPPVQTITEEDVPATPQPQTTADPDIEEDFYGDEGFEADEFDEEGFDIVAE